MLTILICDMYHSSKDKQIVEQKMRRPNTNIALNAELQNELEAIRKEMFSILDFDSVPFNRPIKGKEEEAKRFNEKIVAFNEKLVAAGAGAMAICAFTI